MHMLELIKIAMKILLNNSAQVKYESKHEFILRLADAWGFKVYNKNLYWTSDKEYTDIWRRFSNNQYILDRKYTLYQLAKSVSKLEGNTAECGVFDGGSSYLMCYATKLYGNRDFKHFAFDSYEGLSEPEEKDLPEYINAFRWKKNDLSCPLGKVKRNLRSFENIEYCKGWIPEKFYVAENSKFSLVHVDVDLYQPTLDSLKFFYPRMVKGGMLICDDFGFQSCPGARKAFNEYMSDKSERIISLTTGQGLIIKQ